MEVAPGVDFVAIAKLADGYSGDDISGVCRDSAMASMRRKVAGKTPAEIRQAPFSLHTLFCPEPSLSLDSIPLMSATPGSAHRLSILLPSWLNMF